MKAASASNACACIGEGGDILAGCCLFFFQAEDGIRDIGVTGVQTCALPIWLRPHERLARDAARVVEAVDDEAVLVAWQVHHADAAGGRLLRDRGGQFGETKILRSEEGRVGEEGRSRWWPYH